MRLKSIVLFFSILTLSTTLSYAGTIRVPQDFPTIQDAVDNASPGDQIRIGTGEWCGAAIDKPLDLVGQGGATIIGCETSPNLGGILRIGFFLPTGNASGTSIRHFVFDGEGVSNQESSVNFHPLSFAVFARDTDDVIVEQNSIFGTVQAITNTQGSGWVVSHNVIEDLTVFTCVGGQGPCGGGDGIVFQSRVGPDRATNNSANYNVINGTVPDTLTLFDMAGIIIFAQDGTIVTNNQMEIPDNPVAVGAGIGILVSDVCCGNSTPFLTSINSFIVNNDARDCEFAIVITLDSNGDEGNSAGTILRGNLGVNKINGDSENVTNRAVMTFTEFP